MGMKYGWKCAYADMNVDDDSHSMQDLQIEVRRGAPRTFYYDRLDETQVPGGNHNHSYTHIQVCVHEIDSKLKSCINT